MSLLPKPPEAYSCKSVFTDGRVTGLFLTPDRRRVDTYSEGELISSVIADRRAGKLIDVNWRSKRATRSSCPDFVFTTQDPLGDLPWQHSGNAIHAGIECVLYTAPLGEHLCSRWIDKATGMVLLHLTEGTDGRVHARVEMRDVIVGPPSDAVFEVPADVRIRSRR